MVFYNNGLSPTGRLPIEIPSSDADVEAQFEDVPCDTANATFDCGFGLDYHVSNSPY
jgi:beta-glucosidase